MDTLHTPNHYCAHACNYCYNATPKRRDRARHPLSVTTIAKQSFSPNSHFFPLPASNILRRSTCRVAFSFDRFFFPPLSRVRAVKIPQIRINLSPVLPPPPLRADRDFDLIFTRVVYVEVSSYCFLSSSAVARAHPKFPPKTNIKSFFDLPGVEIFFSGERSVFFRFFFGAFAV